MHQKIVAVLLTLFTLFSLSACTSSTGAATLLSPPSVGGDMQSIEQTLQKNVTGNYTLKYPTAGDYRSAYILADLFSTGQKEFALAFYSVIGLDNITAMHLNLMKKVDEEWVSYSDVQISAVGVEKIELCDLDNDGVQEIIVGWNIYSGVEKKVVIYSLSADRLSTHFQEHYTEFICGNLRNNNKNDLFLIYHNADQKQSVAKVLAYENNAFRTVSECALSGAATSFSAPQLSHLTDGTPAMFIDSTLTTGTQTEVLFFKDNSLVNPMLENAENGITQTFRSSAAACCDINNDNSLDIPIMYSPNITYTVPQGNNLFPLTKWCSYDGAQTVVTLMAAMNYTDGYYLILPKRWENKIVVQHEPESRSCTVLLFLNGSTPTELVRIKTVSESEWTKQDNGYSAYTELAAKNGMVFIAMPGVYTGEEAVTVTEMKSIFHTIQ